nr:TPA_asm: hypothetical protein [Dugejap virus 1]
MQLNNLFKRTRVAGGNLPFAQCFLQNKIDVVSRLCCDDLNLESHMYEDEDVVRDEIVLDSVVSYTNVVSEVFNDDCGSEEIDSVVSSHVSEEQEEVIEELDSVVSFPDSEIVENKEVEDTEDLDSVVSFPKSDVCEEKSIEDADDEDSVVSLPTSEVCEENIDTFKEEDSVVSCTNLENVVDIKEEVDTVGPILSNHFELSECEEKLFKSIKEVNKENLEILDFSITKLMMIRKMLSDHLKELTSSEVESLTPVEELESFVVEDENEYIIKLYLLPDRRPKLPRENFIYRRIKLLYKYYIIHKEFLDTHYSKVKFNYQDYISHINFEIKHMHEQKTHFEAQMEDSFEPEIFGLPTVDFNKINSVIDNSLEITDNVKSMTVNMQQFQGVIASIQSKFSNICIMSNLATLISRIYLFIDDLFHNPSLSRIPAHVVSILGGLVPSTLISSLSDKLISVLNQVLNGILPYVKGEKEDEFYDTINVDFEAQFEEGQEKQSLSLLPTIMEVLKYTFVNVFRELNPSEYKSYNISTSHIRTFVMGVSGIKSIYSYVLSILNFFFEHFNSYLVMLHGVLPEFITGKFFVEKNIYTEVDTVVSGGYHLNCSTNRDSASKVIRLREKILKVLENKSAAYGEIMKHSSLYLNLIYRMVDSWYNDIPPSFRPMTNVERVKPIFTYLYGASGIGKTTTIVPILSYALLKKIKLIDMQEKWDVISYTRNLGEEFWTGYHGQPITSVTDAFQEKADIQKLDKTVTELTRCNDDNIFPLNMAHLDEKGKTFFNSAILMVDGQDCVKNAVHLTERTWSHGGEHLLRRIDFNYHIKLNPIYSESGKIGINYDALNKALDEGKSSYGYEKKYIPDDLYHVDKVHPISGEILESYNSFQTFVTSFVTSAERQYKTSKNVKSVKEGFIDLIMEGQMFSDDENVYEDSVGCSCPIEFNDMDMYKYYGFERPAEHTCFKNVEQFYEFYSNKMVVDSNKHTGKIHKYLKLYKNSIEKTYKEMQRKFDNLIIDPVYLTVGSIISIIGVSLGLVSLSQFRKPITYNNHVKENITDQTIEQKARQKYSVRVRRMRNAIAPQIGYSELEQRTQNMMNVVKNNIIQIQIFNGKNGLDSLGSFSALNVGGNVFATIGHGVRRVLDSFKRNGQVTFKRINDKVPIQIYPEYFKVMPMEKMAEYIDDVQFFQITNIQAGRTLTECFTSFKNSPILSDSYLLGIRSPAHVCTDDCNIIFNGKLKIEMLPVDDTTLHSAQQIGIDATGVKYPIKDLNGNITEMEIKTFYRYSKSLTSKGDCGMILVHDDNSLLGKICGMHIAGDQKKQVGVSSLLCKEDVEDALLYFKSTKKQIEKSKYISDQLPTNGLGEQCLDLELYSCGSTAEYVNDKGTVCDYKVNVPCRTELCKSVLCDFVEKDFGKNTKSPAKLTRFYNQDGELVSPLKLALAKMNNITQPIEGDKFEMISKHISETLLSLKSPILENTPRVLNYDEALNGNNFLGKMDALTSSGFPFVKMKSSTRKICWFETEVLDSGEKYFHVTQELKEIIESRLKYAKENIIAETIFNDCLKDELRKNEKVVVGKTRLFQICPIDLVVLMRMYFGDFIAHCQATYIDGEIAVGINMTSIHWSLLIKRMMKVGDKFLCGDYSNYDASLTFQLATIATKAANDFYDDGEENALVRSVLINTLFSSDHLVSNLLYTTSQGHPSGEAMTTVLNCICNMALFRYTYLNTVCNNLDFYNELVSGTFYGDDNLLCVSDKIIGKFNMLTHCMTMENLGISYTLASKKEVSEPFVTLQDVEYMSRKNVMDTESGHLIARLDFDNIIEQLRWAHGDPMNVEDQINRINSCLLELSAYGREQFEFVRSKIVKYTNFLRNEGVYGKYAKYVSFNIPVVRIFHYEYCRNLWFPGLYNEYTNSEILYDLECQMDDDTEKSKIALNTYDDSSRKEIECDEEQCVAFSYTPYVEVDMNTLINRLYVVKQFKWTTSQTVGMHLWTLDMPEELMKIMQFYGRIKNIAYWSPDFEVHIRVNGTAMHYGRLVFAWIPQHQSLKANYTRFTCMFGNPWYQLSPNSREALCMKIPFTHYKMRVSIPKQESIFGLYCYVAVPLQCTDVTSSVNCTVFVKIIEPRFAAYMPEMTLEAQLLPSDVADTITDIASVIKSIPIIGAFAEPISIVSSNVSAILKWFGLSVPNPTTQLVGVQTRPSRVLQIEDVIHSIPLTVSENTPKDWALVNDSIGNMTLLSVLQHPQLIDTFEITGTSTGNVYTKWLCPANCRYTGLDTDQELGMTHLSYLNRLFSFWRGGLRFHFSFVATQFHSTRVIIYYIPHITTKEVKKPRITADGIADSIGTIVDVVGETSVSFTVPYLQTVEWLETRVNKSADPSLTCNGALGMDIVNQLVCANSTTTKIYVQVFISVAEDFEFSLPNTSGVTDTYGFAAQIYEYVEHTPISTDYKTLRAHFHPVLSGSNIPLAVNISSQNAIINTVKQLTNMVSPIDLSHFMKYADVKLTVGGEISSKNISSINYNYLFNMIGIYRYYRGGIRVVSMGGDNTTKAGVYAERNQGSYMFAESTVPVIIENASDADMRKLSVGMYIFFENMNSMDFTIPWVSQYKCTLGTINNDRINNVHALAATIYFEGTVPCLNIGGADDFIMGHLVGAPMLSKNFSNTNMVKRAKIYKQVLEDTTLDDWICILYDTSIVDEPVYSLCNGQLKGSSLWPKDLSLDVNVMPGTNRFANNQKAIFSLSKYTIGHTLILVLWTEPGDQGLSLKMKTIGGIPIGFNNKCQPIFNTHVMSTVSYANTFVTYVMRFTTTTVTVNAFSELGNSNVTMSIAYTPEELHFNTQVGSDFKVRLFEIYHYNTIVEVLDKRIKPYYSPTNT